MNRPVAHSQGKVQARRCCRHLSIGKPYPTCEKTAFRRSATTVRTGERIAGSDSYSHIYTLGRDHGQAIASAALLPLAGDGLIAAASSAMLVASRQGRDVPVLARVMLLAGIGATITANVGYGLHAGITGALLSVWPVAGHLRIMMR